VVVGRFGHGIDHIVQFALIVKSAFQLALQIGKLFLCSLEAVLFPRGCKGSAADMVEVHSDMCKQMAAPSFATKALVAVVIPVLGGGIQSEARQHDDPSFENVFHSSKKAFPVIIITYRGVSLLGGVSERTLGREF